MKVDLKCFAILKDHYECDYKDCSRYDLSEGQTVSNLIEKAGISKGDIKIIFVNGRKVDFDTELSDGDRVGLAPAVGGM